MTRFATLPIRAALFPVLLGINQLLAYYPVLDTIDIYDPATGAVSAAGELSTRRASFSMTALQDGKLLIAGGSDGSIDLASAEIYDVSTGVSTPAGSMTTARKGHMAYLLPDNNQVLLVGGAAGGWRYGRADEGQTTVAPGTTNTCTLADLKLHSPAPPPNSRNSETLRGTYLDARRALTSEASHPEGRLTAM